MNLKSRVTLTVVVLMMFCLGSQASHFRGGTISWKPLGGRTVRFDFKLGWTYGNGPGCTPGLIGKLVTKLNDFWVCQKGCTAAKAKLASSNYYCSGADKAADWEQGQNNFTHTFPNTHPIKVGYEGTNWIKLSNGKGNSNWNLATTVDLRTRSDTGQINSSPVSLSKPMYYTQFECQIVLHIPVSDPDGDTVRCRWANGGECLSICHALPGAYLDEETCTIYFNTTTINNYKRNGIYGVALAIEDFPRTAMKMGGRAVTPADAISSVPLQFLVKTVPDSGPCDSVPRFVSPTPAENQVITVEEGDTVSVDLVADNGNDTSVKADVIRAAGPVTLKLSPVVPDATRTNTFQRNLTWVTTHSDIGVHIVCASVENRKRKSGHDRCFNIKVVPKGCKSSPCKNHGSCTSAGTTGNYSCTCRPGFVGANCEINVDDCKPNPCLTGTYCVDGNNAHTCVNGTTTTTIPLQLCPLEYNCQCVSSPHHHRYHSLWTGLSRRLRDVLAFVFGLPFGLFLSLVTFWTYQYCVQRHDAERKTHPRTKPQELQKPTRASDDAERKTHPRTKPQELQKPTRASDDAVIKKSRHVVGNQRVGNPYHKMQ